jgi:hypothetical protein
MAHEANPLSGDPFFNEVLFCHEPSKTLMITDFFWNIPTSVPPATLAFKLGMDYVYKPVYFNVMIKNPGERVHLATHMHDLHAHVCTCT